MVRATLDTHLRVRVGGLPQQALSQICAALSIENPERAIAIREILWNAKMLPKTIDLYRFEGSSFLTDRIGETPTTPEASTWVMTLIGLAAVTFAGYRNSRNGRFSTLVRKGALV